MGLRLSSALQRVWPHLERLDDRARALEETEGSPSCDWTSEALKLEALRMGFLCVASQFLAFLRLGYLGLPSSSDWHSRC